MKAIFVADLHGSEWKYDRLFKVAKDVKADIVINAVICCPNMGSV